MPGLAVTVLDAGAASEGAAPAEAFYLKTPPDVTRGRADRMEVSITFDGGAEDTDAEAILDALKERGIKTTVFLTGRFITRYPGITRRIAADGHEVGNHTMNHPHLTGQGHRTLEYVGRTLIFNELNETARLYRETTGQEMAPLWRAPYGEINPEIRAWAFEAGYVHVGWTSNYRKRESLDSLDWVSDRSSRLYRTPYQIKERILNFGRESGGVRGGIILMHLSTDRTADRASAMLGSLLDSLAARGYRFVKVSKLIEGTGALEAVRALRSGRFMSKADGPAVSAGIRR